RQDFCSANPINVSAIDGEPTGETITRPKPKKFPGEQGKPGHSTLCRTLSLKPLRIHRPSVYRAFMVTSKGLCQQEREADALRFVLMGEDREEDAVPAGFVLKDAHGSGCSAHFAKARLNGVGGSHSFLSFSVLYRKQVKSSSRSSLNQLTAFG